MTGRVQYNTECKEVEKAYMGGAWASWEMQTKFLSNKLEMKKLVWTWALLIVLDTVKIVMAKLVEE